MAHRRKGAAGYLEAFVLIAAAVGGSGLVLGAATGYYSTLPAGSVSLSGASIRQGSFAATEAVTIFNSGRTASGPIVVSTEGVPANDSYCYTVLDPWTQAALSSTCPSMALGPGAVAVPAAIPPGAGVVFEMLLVGPGLLVGSSHLLTVTTSSGAQQTVDVQVVPA